MTMEERKAKGLLWTDTPEAMEAQARARGLVYDLNHTRPEEKEKRMDFQGPYSHVGAAVFLRMRTRHKTAVTKIGRASCRERV